MRNKKPFHLFIPAPVVLLTTFFKLILQHFGNDSFDNYTFFFCCCFFSLSVSLTYNLSWCCRRFIKHPVITRHSLIVNECKCLCAGVSAGNYLMLWSLMTTQTNICPKVIYKMRDRPSVVPVWVCSRACTNASVKTRVSIKNTHLIETWRLIWNTLWQMLLLF